MPRDPDKAISFKKQGNDYFGRGEYASAESLYSKAIIADDTNPALYTNRAFARIKLKLWEFAVEDCEACLKLNQDNMKAHYYIAQAHFELGNFEDAVVHANRAREITSETGDRSLTQVAALVLASKKARWEAKEKKRRRAHQELEKEVIAMMEKERDKTLEDANMDQDDRNELNQEWSKKMAELRAVFQRARDKDNQVRSVPSWAIDEISFNYMTEPMVALSGKSYEKSSILKALERKPEDPVTRGLLFEKDLRPNLNLKEACDQFLEENGWAADW